MLYIKFDKMQYVGKDSSLFPRVMRQAFDKWRVYKMRQSEVLSLNAVLYRLYSV